MAVQIPAGVQRADVQPTAPAGRIQAQAPDLMGAMRPQNEAVSNAVETAAKYVIKKEEDAADIKATEIANQYERERLETLTGPNGLVHMKGDVTAAYDKYQADGRERMNQFLTDNENVSALTKRKMTEKLMEVDQRYYMKSTIAQGKQNNDYIESTINDRVELLKNDLQTSTGLLDANDPTSFAPMKYNISAIIQERYSMAEKLNIPKESVNLQIAKDLSGGIESSISTLNSSGRPDLAEAVLQQYGNFLDARTRPRAIEETRKKKIDVEAADLAREAESKGAGAAAFIDKIKDDETRNKAWEFFDASKRRHEYEQKRNNDDTYNRLALHVMNRQNGPNPYLTKTALEQDPVFAKSIRYVTEADDVKKLYSLIDRKNESDPKQVRGIMNSFLENQLPGMPVNVLEGKLAGLSESDYKFYRGLWVDANKDPDSQRRSRFDWASKRLQSRMEGAGLIKYSDGKMTSSSKKLWDQTQSNLLRRSGDFPKTMDEAAYEKEIDNIIAGEVKNYNDSRWFGWGKIDYKPPQGADSVRKINRRQQVPNSPLMDTPPAPSTTTTTSPVTVDTPKPTTVVQKNIQNNGAPKNYSVAEMTEGTKLFKQANNGQGPKNVSELKKFMQERGM